MRYLRRHAWIAVAAVVLGTALVGARPAAGAEPAWWSGSFTERLAIDVKTSASSLPAAYSLSVQLDHASLVAAGSSLANGNDVRIAHWNGGGWSEVDRVLAAGSAWNTGGTTIWFATQNSIGVSTIDTSYYLYFGNPSAGEPPADPANVYAVYDDFAGTGAVDPVEWYTTPVPGGTVDRLNGELRVTGVSDPLDPWEVYGAMKGDIPDDDYAVDVSFRIVSQQGNGANQWRAHLGAWEMYLKMDWGPRPRAGYWDAGLGQSVALSEASVPPSVPTSTRFTVTRNGSRAEAWLGSTFLGSRSNAMIVEGETVLAYSPDVTDSNSPFDVRFDDLVVRKYAVNPPTVTLESTRLSVDVIVDPSLSLTVAGISSGSCNGTAPTSTAATPSSVSLGGITPSGNGVAGQDLITVANADSGYSLYLRASTPAQGASGSLDNWSGTHGGPTTFPAAGTEAVAYTTSDTDFPQFQPGKWAGLPATAEAVGRSLVGPFNETVRVCFQAGVAATTPAGNYQTTVVYSAVPTF